jgi:hypothetical protein
MPTLRLLFVKKGYRVDEMIFPASICSRKGSLRLRDFLTQAILLPSQILAVKKIPGGPRMQVFAVTIGSLAFCAIPVYWKQEKQGHDLFSQEKPEAVRANEEKLQKEFRKQKNQQS